MEATQLCWGRSFCWESPKLNSTNNNRWRYFTYAVKRIWFFEENKENENIKLFCNFIHDDWIKDMNTNIESWTTLSINLNFLNFFLVFISLTPTKLGRAQLSPSFCLPSLPSGSSTVHDRLGRLSIADTTSFEWFYK